MATRVLVVDDDTEVAGAVVRMVRRARPAATVEVFHDVASARERAGEVTFDLALLDVNVAGESGAVLARALREREPGLPIAFMTGEPESAWALDARSLAPIDVMAKPFASAAMVALVARALGGVGRTS